MGTSFTQFMTYVGGFPALPSGIAMTSLFGTLCSIKAYSTMESAFPSDSVVVILGDDVNVLSRKVVRRSIPGILEFQEDDYVRQFLLGLSFKDDPAAPRAQGIKLTGDRADKAQPASLIYGGTRKKVVGHHHPEAIKLWCDLYRGMVGDRTLIDALKSVPAYAFRGPGEMIQEIPQREFEGLETWKVL